MGAIIRMNLEEKVKEIFKKELNTSDVVVWISGGVAYVDKNNLSTQVMVIDLDNLSDELSSKTITESKAIEYGVSFH